VRHHPRKEQSLVDGENAERCTYNGTKLNNGMIVNMQKEKGWKCTKDHPDYKLTWGRLKIG